MSKPTDKPVDRVTVLLSDEDFKRVVGNSMEEILSPEKYGGRIEVTAIGTQHCDERTGWYIDTLFIPADAT